MTTCVSRTQTAGFGIKPPRKTIQSGAFLIGGQTPDPNHWLDLTPDQILVLIQKLTRWMKEDPAHAATYQRLRAKAIEYLDHVE